MARVTKPSWLEGSDLWSPLGPRNAPALTLPDGKISTGLNRFYGISPASLTNRGNIKAVMDTSIVPDTLRMQWTHSKDFAFTHKSGWEDLTQQDCIDMANRSPVTGYEADELMEGDPYGCSDPNRPHFLWYYNARKEMYADSAKNPTGIPWKNFGTYGSWAVWNGDPWETKTGDGSQKAPNDTFFASMVANQAAARNNVIYFGNGFSDMGLGAIIKHYADTPDYASRYYNKAFAAERMSLAMGSARGVGAPMLMYVDWGKIEGLGSSTNFQHNGFYYTRDVGGIGKAVFQEHPQVDYNWQVGNIFCIGYCRCNGYIPFDSGRSDRFGTNPAELSAMGNGSTPQWIPYIPGTPAPVTTAGYPTEPLGWYDAGYEAAYYYSMCSRTAGQPWLYSKYMLQGMSSNITVKTDGTTILDHASAFDGPYKSTPGARKGRTDSMYRISGNALDIWAFDPSRPASSKEDTILNPTGSVYINIPQMKGSTLYLFNETI